MLKRQLNCTYSTQAEKEKGNKTEKDRRPATRHTLSSPLTLKSAVSLSSGLMLAWNSAMRACSLRWPLSAMLLVSQAKEFFFCSVVWVLISPKYFGVCDEKLMKTDSRLENAQKKHYLIAPATSVEGRYGSNGGELPDNSQQNNEQTKKNTCSMQKYMNYRK